MTLSMNMIKFELEERGFLCSLHMEVEKEYKGFLLLSNEIESFRDDYIYVVDSAEPLIGLSGISVIMCNPGKLDLSELSVSYLCLRAALSVQTLMNMLSEIQQHYNAYTERLFSLAMYQGNLNEMVNILAEFFGNPVYLIDASFKLLVISSQTELPFISLHFKRLIEFGYMPINTVVSLLDNKEWKADIDAGGVSFVKIDPFFCPFINCKLKERDKLLGHLFVVEVFKRVSPRDIDLAKRILPIIHAVARRVINTEDMAGQYYEYYLRDIIDGKVDNKQVIAEQANALGWEIDNSYCVLFCPIPKQKAPAAKLLAGDFIDTLGAKTTIFQNTMYCVFCIQKFEQYDRLIYSASDLLKHYQLDAGLSVTFQGFHLLHNYAEQAKIAYELGCQYPTERRVYPYTDYALTHLLRIYKEHVNAECFYSSSYTLLRKYDNENNTDYVKTMYVYLKNERNLSKASEILYIHRNTLLQRIKKIRDILNTDFELASSRIHFMLSYEMQAD